MLGLIGLTPPLGAVQQLVGDAVAGPCDLVAILVEARAAVQVHRPADADWRSACSAINPSQQFLPWLTAHAQMFIQLLDFVGHRNYDASAT